MLDLSSIATWATVIACAAALLAGAALCLWRPGPRRRPSRAEMVHAMYQATAAKEAALRAGIEVAIRRLNRSVARVYPSTPAATPSPDERSSSSDWAPGTTQPASDQ